MTSIVIADYRWKGHRLTHILAVAEMMHARSKRAYLHLPSKAYSSREWQVHSRENSENIERLGSFQDVPQDLESWVEDVMTCAMSVEANLLLLPWADSLVPHLLKYRNNTALHVHLLLGRCPPGFLEYAEGTELAEARQRLILANELMETGFACVGSLCAAIDLRAGSIASRAEGGVRWIVDPVDSISPLTRQAARKLLGLEKSRRYAVLLGDLSARKKSEEVALAWPRIYDQTGMKLVLAGEVDQSAPNLHNIANEQPEYIKTKFGYLSNEDFKHYIAAADVVLGTFQAGIYMSSGVSGVAAVTGTPMFVDGNRYLERMANIRSFGVVGNIEAPEAVELLYSALSMQVQATPIENVDYTRFFHQWCESCV